MKDNPLALVWGDEISLDCQLKDSYGNLIDLTGIKNDKITLRIYQNNNLKLEVTPCRIDDKSNSLFLIFTSLLEIGTAIGEITIDHPIGVRTCELNLQIIEPWKKKEFNPSMRGS